MTAAWLTHRCCGYLIQTSSQPFRVTKEINKQHKFTQTEDSYLFSLPWYFVLVLLVLCIYPISNNKQVLRKSFGYTLFQFTERYKKDRIRIILFKITTELLGCE